MANQALNPASQQWGRDVTKANEANTQALVRTTMNLQNTDRALEDAITRLNRALEVVKGQNDYILSLTTHHVSSPTGDIIIPANSWTTNEALRPSVTLLAPTGRIRVLISAYGHNAAVTFSIAGVRTKESTVNSYLNQTSQLVLPGGTASMVSQREWVQTVPVDKWVTVQVECKAVGADPVVASPTLIVQVIPA